MLSEFWLMGWKGAWGGPWLWLKGSYWAFFAVQINVFGNPKELEIEGKIEIAINIWQKFKQALYSFIGLTIL